MSVRCLARRCIASAVQLNRVISSCKVRSAASGVNRCSVLSVTRCTFASSSQHGTDCELPKCYRCTVHEPGISARESYSLHSSSTTNELAHRRRIQSLSLGGAEPMPSAPPLPSPPLPHSSPPHPYPIPPLLPSPVPSRPSPPFPILLLPLLSSLPLPSPPLEEGGPGVLPGKF